MLSPIDGSGQGAASSIQDAALPPSQEEVPLSVGAVWDHIKEIKRASLIEAAAESERNLKSEHQVHEVHQEARGAGHQPLGSRGYKHEHQKANVGAQNGQKQLCLI